MFSKVRAADANDKTIITLLPNPAGIVSDPLTELRRQCARKLIRQAVEAEPANMLDQHANDPLKIGHTGLVRNRHLPKREVQIEICAVPVKELPFGTAARTKIRPLSRYRCRRLTFAKQSPLRKYYLGCTSKAFPRLIFTKP